MEGEKKVRKDFGEKQAARHAARMRRRVRAEARKEAVMKIGELQGKIVHLHEVQEAAVLKDRRICIDDQIAGKWYEDRMLDYVRENRGKRCIVKEDGDAILRVEVIEEVKTGLYRHYKGTLYTVIGEAFHTETGEQLVLYRKTEGVVNESPIWARPADMFVEEVDGVPRFEFLG